MTLDLIGLLKNKRNWSPDETIVVWECRNCVGDMAVVKLVRYDDKWLWAFRDSEHRADWLGFTDWVGVKKRLEEFHGGRRKAYN